MQNLHWTTRCLAWWSARGGFLLFFVFFFSFIFVLIFGNYPHWIYKKQHEEFQQYLNINEQNLSISYFTESVRGNALVSLVYHDGFTPTSQNKSRPNKSEIVSKYKVIVASRICSHPIVLQNLGSGNWHNVSVDVRDGEASAGKPYLFNLQLDKKRYGV